MELIVKNALKMAEAQLREAGDSDAKVDAELLYMYLFRLDHAQLFMEWKKTLPAEKREAYFALIRRRAAGEPTQYIIGTQAFMGMEFAVNRNVLIPRRETETLVEVVQKEILRRGTRVRVLDLCCGSGCIGISLEVLCEKAKVTCADISPFALEVARRNADKLRARVEFVQGDLFSPVRGRTFDLIVTNPPYIRSEEIGGLQREVRDHEPRLALDGGEDGLLYYRSIVREAAPYLREDGILFMEIGCEQAVDIRLLAERFGSFRDVSILRDLSGHNRIAVLKP